MRRPTPLALVLLTLAAGCAESRTPPPDVTTPAAPAGTSATAYPDQGISFAAPGGWHLERGTPPLVATVQTGEATIAIWRYPRTERLPRTRTDLDAAVQALTAAAQARDPSFHTLRTTTLRVGGTPAVQIRARQSVDGQPRVVRSTHVYGHGAEVVVDAYTSVATFRRVDEQAFRPLLRSLRLTRPRGTA